MTIQNAFLAGMKRLKNSGITVRGHDPEVIVAEREFRARIEQHQNESWFDTEAPKQAAIMILRCLIIGCKV